jgi:hypothetical protein
MLVKGIGYVGGQKVIEHDVLGLAGGEFSSQFGKAVEDGGIDDRFHGRLRKRK